MIQIIGTKKCKDTQKAIRFLKERNIQFQFIDLQVKGLSAGELKKVSQKIPLDELMDKDSKEYEQLNLKYIRHDPFEKLLEHPLLLKTPIIRKQNSSSLGFDADKLKALI
ncbi:MAG TPA: ArsC/Spx/MgsR family protein [Candidatus Cloacimonadota bacterium]|jgi:arsenate reductase-like glutaredoxin family protein|nr:ArsC/Spx/MgsR family protein [Candidatus Cloacimonadales bacterium]HOE90656.1 ArsC/Spx/MgsR family protein [Candidatus Cloacimonadota bacterium]HPK41058.1 ArsC/Spx/MgsR family protein [Candidatus Cloacimonadota bacterium]HPY96794.1 ArsC/Spx/MgsR family protein [Candidatus Cloacimonadota bacterium]HQB41214.1 ArsC/Spx/MgsR family protein [Candidatus Cloacimonadota bacterium]